MIKRIILIWFLISLSIYLVFNVIPSAVKDFQYGYELGFNNMQDTMEYIYFADKYEYGDWCGHYQEGVFDYWDETPFWFQQGYEEGMKDGAFEYIYEGWYGIRPRKYPDRFYALSNFKKK